MSNQEKEYSRVDQLPFEEIRVTTNDGYVTHLPKDDNHETDAGNLEGERCVASSSNAVLRLQPMILSGKNNSPRWKGGTQFHELLEVSPSGSGLCILLEARAREGLALALSPEKGFVRGYTYEIILGDRGNTAVTLRRKSTNTGNNKKEESEALLSVRRPARVCQENVWTHYWICFMDYKLYAGIGEKPGEECVALLDDIARQDRPPSDDRRVRYVGLGNCGTGDRLAPSALRLRNIKLLAVPKSVREKIKLIKETELELVMVGEAEMDDETKALMMEYQEECKKARARADKFGVAYKEPPTDIPWSHVRKLRANPQQGFITGLDLADPDEKNKQEARKKRFGSTQKTDDQLGDAVETKNDALLEKENEADDLLTVEQAWETESLVKSMRIDPPGHLWKEPPSSGSEKMNEPGNQAQENDASYQQDATLTPEKIHLFGIDWAAFKQIRTNDVMKYFASYGPTYVEWLGDLSCNVLFQDKFSAIRAIENLSMELPTNPPPPLSDTVDKEKIPIAQLGKMGWRLGKAFLRKVTDDRFGRRGTTARVILRTATSLDVLNERPSSWPKPPPGFSTKRILGPGSDFPDKIKGKKGKKRSRETQDVVKERKINRKDDSLSRNEMGEPSLLDQGLKATRPGFSAEDLHAERSMKRAKTSQND